MTGAGGMLGQDVLRVAGPDAVGLTRAELDVTDGDAVRAAIGPDDVVINCAAWTDVDGAEEHPEDALRVNADGARNVAAAAGRRDLRVERLRLRRDEGQPVRRVRPAQPGVRLRALEGGG